MQLQDIVEKYRKLEWDFGKPVELSRFGLSREETERVFSVFDEDYHISRFFHLSEREGEKYSLNGVDATHVSVDSEIQAIL